MPRNISRGQRIAADTARTRAGEKQLTQAELAELLGMSEKAIWNFFNGKTWPQSRTLVAIERALGWTAGHLAEVASRYDHEVQDLDDTSPTERVILELIQALRMELDGTAASEFGQTVQRDLKRLAAQLVDLGVRVEVPPANVRPLKLRPVDEIRRDIEHEESLRVDTLSSGVPGAEAIAERIHDPKILAYRAELELAERYGESSVTGS